MENEKFQEFMADQFTKLFKEFQGLTNKVDGLDGKVTSLDGKVTSLDGKVTSLDGKVISLDGKVEELKGIQLRMEDKFDKQITSLYDFKDSQDKANQENRDFHNILSTKIEELQMETASLRRVK